MTTEGPIAVGGCAPRTNGSQSGVPGTSIGTTPIGAPEKPTVTKLVPKNAAQKFEPGVMPPFDGVQQSANVFGMMLPGSCGAALTRVGTRGAMMLIRSASAPARPAASCMRRPRSA